MTISYFIAPVPKWLFTDISGNILESGSMRVSYQNDQNTRAPVYQDSGGGAVWPTNSDGAIDFSSDGMQGPFYWAYDDTLPTQNQTYFLEIFDRNGVPQFTINNYPITLGSGGGGTVTTVSMLQNYVVNNVFTDNSGNADDVTATDLTSKTNYLLAPSAHQQFSGPTATRYGADSRFVKSNTTCTDSFVFKNFDFGSNDLDPDFTPKQYLNLLCTNAVGGTETYKAVQIAVCPGLQNFSGETVSISIWAKASSTKSIAMGFLYFYGDGGVPTATDIKIPQSFTLTTSWAKHIATGIVLPSVNGDSRGTCKNDALFLNIALPINDTYDISFTKPCMFLGEVLPTEEFQDPDFVSSIVNSPRTGDIRTSLNSFAPFGWVPMNDGTIGTILSGSTTRANEDTYPLYELIWNSVSNTYAPVTGGRGVSASADFVALKPLQLTRTLGRVMAGALGASTTAGLATTQTALTFTDSTVTDLLTVSSTTGFNTGVPVLVSTSGGALPTPLVAGTVYYAINVSATTLKLATTAANAIAGTAIDLTVAGTPTNTITLPAYELGSYQGNYTHTLTTAQLPNPLLSANARFYQTSAAGGTERVISGTAGDGNPTGTVDNINGGQAHNNIQNTVFYNIFAKL